MSENPTLKHSFSIQRHAVQRLFRQALDAAPAPVAGFLGGHGDVVDSVFPVENADNIAEVRDSISLCHQQGRRVLATYASAEDSAKTITARQAECLTDMVTDAMFHVHIHTDTRGRIDVELHGKCELEGDEIQPLEMQEDGGLYPTSDNS